MLLSSPVVCGDHGLEKRKKVAHMRWVRRRFLKSNVRWLMCRKTNKVALFELPGSFCSRRPFCGKAPQNSSLHSPSEVSRVSFLKWCLIHTQVFFLIAFVINCSFSSQRLFWPKSRCFDYLYQDAEMLLRNYPVQATICLYEDSSSDEDSDDEEEEMEKELN